MVTGAYYPEQSGAGLQCRALVAQLTSVIQFTILTTTTDRSLPVDDVDGNVPVHRVFVDPRRPATKIAAMVRFVRILMRHRWSAVHLHGFSQKSMLVIAVSMLARRPVAIKLTSVGHDDPIAMTRRGRLAWWCYGRATRFFGVSSAMQGLFEQSSLPRDRFRLIPNGVDVDRFTPADAGEYARLRRELSIPEGGPPVLCVGFFSREKQPDVLFDAWARVAATDDRCGPLVFVGATRSSYYEIDPMLADEIRRRAAAVNLAHRIVFVEQTFRIEDYYRAARIFVLPSAREGLPNALLEAMASGLACVATRLPGVTDDIIDDGEDGLLVDRSEPGALESALRQLVANPDRAAAMGVRARDKAVSRFAIRDVAARYLAAYSEMVS